MLSVISIPTLKYSTGYGTSQIRNWVEKAVGIDIFANK
jgi:V/A-type H+-transporting ATPase subunit F